MNDQWPWVIGAYLLFYGTLAGFAWSVAHRIRRARARLRELS